MRFKLLMVTLLYFVVASRAYAHHLVASTGKDNVHLIELYSSEACSSCPPADKWISSLIERVDLWKSFVPVVFHVDYWNDLGWTDSLSSNSMTLRQREVAKTWKVPSVYTPAVVVDGQEWQAWSTAREFPKEKSPTHILLSVYHEEDGTFEVSIGALPTADQYTVRIAKLGMDMNSNVTSGENSGRLLNHNFVVLDWNSKSVNPKTAKVSFRLDGKKSAPKMAIAVWIEKTGHPRPLQAVGGYL